MKQFCPKCGKWYDVSGNVCPICRSQLLVPNNNTNQIQPNLQPQQVLPPSPIPNEIRKKNTKGCIMLVLGIAMLFFCFVFFEVLQSSNWYGNETKEYIFIALCWLCFASGGVLLAFGIKLIKDYSDYIQKHQRSYNLSQMQDNPLIECPYCHSHKVIKISASDRVGSAIIVGIASSKIGKQWHCHNCNSDF